jgi:hypothetical protein
MLVISVSIIWTEHVTGRLVDAEKCRECKAPQLNVLLLLILKQYIYSASHSRVASENVGLKEEQKCNTFACNTCNEVRLCVFGIRKKEVGNTKR